MLSLRFIILFWVNTRIGLQALVLKKHISFSHCPVPQHCIPPLPETLHFSSCLFKPPSSWTLSLLRLVGSLMSEPAPLTTTEQLCRRNCKVPNYLLGIKCANVTQWCSLMSQSHGIKGGTTNEAFQEQRFQWERGTSICANFAFFHFLDFFTCMTTYIKHWRKGVKKNLKSIMGLL